jgi:hypothetical protein
MTGASPTRRPLTFCQSNELQCVKEDSPNARVDYLPAMARGRSRFATEGQVAAMEPHRRAIPVSSTLPGHGYPIVHAPCATRKPLVHAPKPWGRPRMRSRPEQQPGHGSMATKHTHRRGRAAMAWVPGGCGVGFYTQAVPGVRAGASSKIRGGG